MIQKCLIEGLQIDPNDTEERFCEACAAGKLTMKPFPKESLMHAKELGKRVHWDLWGPASMNSLGGKLLQFNLVRVGIHELRPKYLVKVTMY